MSQFVENPIIRSA